MMLKVCKESLRKWKDDPRIFAAAMLVCLFEWTKIEPIRKFCLEKDIAVSNWFFSFLFASPMNTMFFFFGILLLFCDAPFFDRQQMFVVLRTGKKNWFAGKILYVFSASFMYFLWMYVVSVLEFLPYVGFSMKWESVFTALSLENKIGNVMISISRTIILEFAPLQAFFMSFSICVLVGAFCGLVIFYLNLFRVPNLGVSITLIFVLVSGVINFFPVQTRKRLLYVSPISWTDITVFVREQSGVPYWYAILFLSTMIILLILLIMKKAKEYNMEAMGEF